MKGISQYYDFVDKHPDSKYSDEDIRVRWIELVTRACNRMFDF